MLRISITVLCYLLIAAPVGWYIWHLSSEYPLSVRVVLECALVLGMLGGRRRRQARKRETFRDFVD